MTFRHSGRVALLVLLCAGLARPAVAGDVRDDGYSTVRRVWDKGDTTNYPENLLYALKAGVPTALTLDVSGNLNVTGAGGGGGGGAVTVADGADVTQGTTTDAAVAGDTAGSVEAHLRYFSKVYADIWNVGHHTLQVENTQPLPAGTNVIGHVIADTGSTTVVTGNVATTVADGANVTIGAKGDAKSTATDTTAVTVMQVLKEISAMAQAPAALPANQSVNFNQVGGTNVVTGGVAGSQSVGGVAAGGTAIASAGNPVLGGAQAITALPTAVSNAQSVTASADKFGRLIVVPGTVRDLVGTVTVTDTDATEDTLLAGVASVFNDLVGVVVSNTSGTAVRVDFRSTTAGSVVFSLWAPAGATVGFMPPVPVPQAAVNTNWTVQASAAVTDLRIFAEYLKNR